MTAAPPSLDGDFDRTTGVMLFKVGRYPLHLGGVSVARTMGRLGIPVGAVTESLRTPLARSRYVTRRFEWATTGGESPEVLLDGLAAIGRRWSQRPVLVGTDDEAAVFVAAHSAELSRWFLLPDVDPSLPRSFADKECLQALCQRHGVATAMAGFPTTHAQLVEFAERSTFPVMVKNAHPWTRLQDPAVTANTVVRSPTELMALAREWSEPYGASLQEFLPVETSEDWIFHSYTAGDGSMPVAFTGIKLRSWPPHWGVTTYAVAADNPALAEEATRFLKATGYRGIVDMDWRFDHRDGRYKLLDANPRLGNQFQLFENDAHINVMRAMHLDLTGRPVPGTRQRSGEALHVEHLDAAAYVAYRRFKSHQAQSPADLDEVTHNAFGWWAVDDVRPFVSVMAGSVRPGLQFLLRNLHQRGGYHPVPGARAAREPQGAASS